MVSADKPVELRYVLFFSERAPVGQRDMQVPQKVHSDFSSGWSSKVAGFAANPR